MGKLYDMDADRTELFDLAGSNQPLESRLQRDYEGWAEACGVEDWSTLEPRLFERLEHEDRARLA